MTMKLLLLRALEEVVLRWIEAISLIEPSRKRQARHLSIAKRAAFFLGS